MSERPAIIRLRLTPLEIEGLRGVVYRYREEVREGDRARPEVSEDFRRCGDWLARLENLKPRGRGAVLSLTPEDLTWLRNCLGLAIGRLGYVVGRPEAIRIIASLRQKLDSAPRLARTPRGMLQ